jgi:signal transduction histidine kinase
MKTNRAISVYVLLVVAWVLICLWQVLEHRRVRESARLALVNRATDISYSLSAVIRSQGRFGVVPQSQLEAALKGLAKSSELLSVALLNAAGQVVASAGQPVKLDVDHLPKEGARWEKDSVTFVNLIDLGGENEGGTTRPATIVLPPDDGRTSPSVRRGPPRPMRQSVNRSSDSVVVSLEFPPDTPTSGPGSIGRMDRDDVRREPRRATRQTVEKTSGAVVLRLEFPPGTPTNDLPFVGRGGEGGDSRRGGPGPPPPGEERGGFRRGGGPGSPRPPRFGRPFWMEESRYQELVEKQGLHGFVLLMSTGAYRAETARDSWLRWIIACVTLATVGTFGLAWRNMKRSDELQMRLIRAGEMNSHLRELNIAAAGLAHETRNPLNIVRGLAQLIAKQEDPSSETRKKSLDIIGEVDRVAGRLSEFIEYSKPREPKPTPTHLNAVVRDVERALESDREDKAIQFALTGPDLVVEADESLLRQLLFNLMLNSMQAVAREGKVEVLVGNSPTGRAYLEIRDNGPGVPENARESLFRPYYTTHEGGTGLGLAVVRQIVLAHGWDVEYIPGEDGGARFRVSGLKVTSKVPRE